MSRSCERSSPARESRERAAPRRYFRRRAGHGKPSPLSVADRRGFLREAGPFAATRGAADVRSLLDPSALDPRRDRRRRADQARAADRRAAGRAHPRRRPKGDARDGQPLRQQLPRPRRSSRRRSPRPRRRSTNSASAWPRCASSAARRRCIASSSRRSPGISARTTRSCSPPVSTPTAACSSRCSAKRTRSSPTALNHASIIDGVRLRKARRYRYANSDMNELEDRLKEADAAGARFKLIATDGVFSMDGYVAKLPDDLRARRALRRAGAGRRLPRDRPSRREGPRHAGADRRGRARRHRHRHVRQDARRRHGRLRRRGAADRRSPAPARAALSLLQQPRPAGRRRLAEGARDRHRGRRPARAAASACAPLPRRAREGRLLRCCRARRRSFR